MTPSIETNSVTTIFPMVTSVCRGMSRETLRPSRSATRSRSWSSGQGLRELVEHGRPAVVRLCAAGLAEDVARHLGAVTEVRERDRDGQINVAVAPDQSLGLLDLKERSTCRVLLAVVVGDHHQLERAARS